MYAFVCLVLTIMICCEVIGYCSTVSIIRNSSIFCFSKFIILMNNSILLPCVRYFIVGTFSLVAYSKIISFNLEMVALVRLYSTVA